MAETRLGFGVWTRIGSTSVALAALLAVGCGGSGGGTTGDGGASGTDGGIPIKTMKTGGDSGSHADGEVETREGGTDAGSDAPKIVHVDAGFPAPFPAVPQVVNAGSGTNGILVNPKIIAIFFSNDDMASVTQYESFYSGLGATAYWTALGEYSVGTPTVQNIILAEAAPATIDDTPDNQGDNTALNNWLQSKITSMEVPATDDNTLYVLNYPASTTVTQYDASCTDWDGYHSDMTDTNNHLIAYAVVPRCPATPGFTLDQSFTTTASHEVVEGATDPWPDYQPGWTQADDAHLFFDEANSGSEIGDMCQDDPEAYITFSDFPFMIQRFWSNAAAKAGHDPCVPDYPNETFFNAIPELPDAIRFPYYGNTAEAHGVKIPVGGSATITLDLYSDAPTAPWTVQVFDYYWFYYSTSNSMSDALLSFDAASAKGITGNNGDKIPVTITVKSAGNTNSNGEVNGTEAFVVQVTQGSGQSAPVHFWYGLVGQ